MLKYIVTSRCDVEIREHYNGSDSIQATKVAQEVKHSGCWPYVCIYLEINDKHEMG